MTLIKRTGLIAVMALALGAWLGAASASASYATAGSYPAIFKGSSEQWRFESTATGKWYACQGIGVDTILVGPTKNFATLSLASAPCEDPRHVETGPTLETHGCALTFRPGAESGSGVFSGTADLGPVGCGPMTLNGSVCKRRFYAQSGIPVTFTNKGSGSNASIVAKISAPLTFYPEGPNSYCDGVSGTPRQMWYTASWELSAYDEEGEPLNTALSELSADGLFISGSGGEQPLLGAESYPVTINGEQTNSSSYTVGLAGNRKLTCSQASLEGMPAGAVSQITLVPNLQACTFTFLGNPYPASVSLNSCQLKLNLLKEGPPYSASLGVECASGGEIQIWAYASAQAERENNPLCLYGFAAQSGLSGVSLENTGSGSSRKVNLTFGVSNLVASRLFGTLTNCGSKTQTSSLTGSGTLIGLH